MISIKNTRVQITMPKELYKLLMKLSKDNNITISNLVNITIIDYLDKANKNFKEKGVNENEKNI
jgi:hypothetical protein